MLPALLSVVVLGGCRTVDPVVPPTPETPPPSWEEIAAFQRTRLERLLPLRASGPVELTWRDERGRRFENCRGDLMLRTVREAALDLRKVGERFMLVGSDERRQWIFDLRRNEEQAWIRPRGGAWPTDGVASGPPVTVDVDLAELFGLFDPDELPLAAPVWDAATGDVVVVLGPSSLRRRISLDPATLLPRRIEVLDRSDEIVVQTELDRHDPVEREGLPPGARPRFPNRVALRSSDGSGEIVLFLRPPETPPRLPERLFSLEALLETFRPPVIHTGE